MRHRHLIVLCIAACLSAGCATEVPYGGIIQSYETRPADFQQAEGRALVACVVGEGHVLGGCEALAARPDTDEVRELALRGAADYDVVGSGFGDLPVGSRVQFWVTVQIR